MKTRTLMLLSLACGVAIMLAGAVFLFQLSTQDDVAEPAAIGASTQVGDMTVTVVGASEAGGVLRVEVELRGAADAAPGDDFRLIASGRPVAIQATTCPAIDGTPTVCEVSFDVAEADGRSRVLFYERGEEQVRWVLDAS